MEKKEDCFKSGIYKIINISNNKVYIGQSKNIKERIKNHFNNLKRGTHHNKYLQYSFDKYKIESFKYEVLIYCSIENLSIEESKYIKLYNSFIKSSGYNLTEDTTRHVLATRKVIGEKNKKLLIQNNINRSLNARKVYQYNLEGFFVKEWVSCLQIKNKLNISRGNLALYLNNFTTTKSLNKSMWRWADGDKKPIEKYSKGMFVKSIQVFKNDIFYKEFKNIKLACLDLKIHRSTIERAIKGIAKNSKNLSFKLK